MIAKMRKVMYLIDNPHTFIPHCHWTASYKEATSNDNIIIATKLFPVDDMTDEQRATREEYRKKVWEKFHKKPQA